MLLPARIHQAYGAARTKTKLLVSVLHRSPGDSLRPHSLGKLVYRVLTKEPYSATSGAGAQSPRTQTWFAMTGPTALYPRCAQNSTTSYRASGRLPCKILDSKAINLPY